MRGRWKGLLSDSFVQLALVLSVLRTDLGVYLRQYSGYPEVQQALLGQSVGLHLVDNYHNNDLLPLPSSKYTEDNNHYIFNELHRAIQSPTYLSQRSPLTNIVSAWLVTNGTAHSSTSTHATSGISQTELSTQEVELIESLWKEDLNSNRGAENIPEEQNEVVGEYLIDEETGDRVNVPRSFPMHSSTVRSSSSTAGPSHWPSSASEEHRPVYGTQSSLDLDLQDLSSYSLTGSSSMVSDDDDAVTNSSMLYPDQPPTVDTPSWGNGFTDNNSGVLWGATMESSDERYLSRQESTVNLDTATDMSAADLPDLSLLSELGLLADDIDITNFDLDLDLSPYDDAGDSVSDDSALGTSPQHSWSDQTSTTGSERNSISSTEPFDMGDGAVGYTKTEPFDKDFFDYESQQNDTADPFDMKDGAVGYTKTELFDEDFFDYESQQNDARKEKGVVYHDHTYGAPPGGIPHVRKMDMKTTKTPTRGLAHDEAMCAKMNIPFSVDTIINSSVDEFNSLIVKYRLNSKQATLVRGIRRRGKNKVAAQNCRQRKYGEYAGLEEEVEALRKKRHSLYQKKTVLLNKTTQTRKHIDIMSAEIFSTLRDEDGIPYNTSQFSLEVGRNGEIQVTSTQRSGNRSRNNNRKRDSNKKKRR